MYLKKKSLDAIFLLLFILLFNPVANSQTWETVFKKSEKAYEKGKFGKIIKNNDKLRKKYIAKKYANDTTIISWAAIMDAQAYEAMKDYPSMNSAILEAAQSLIGIKNQNELRYTQGQLRLIDLYNDYGNFKKSDSILNILIDKFEYFPTSVLSNEILLRKAITDLNNGKYVEADASFKELEKVWMSILKLPYESEIVTDLDIQHRQEMLALIYVGQLRCAIERGEYARAEIYMNEFNRTVDKMISSTSQEKFQWLIAKAQLYYDEGDYEKARKNLEQFFSAKPIGNNLEDGILLKTQIEYAAGNAQGVFKTRDEFWKYTGKAKINAKYRTAHLLFIDALDDHLDQQMDETFKNINDAHFISEQILPKDHPTRKLIYEYGIGFSQNAEEHRYHQAANSYYPFLLNHISSSYADGLYHDIYKIQKAGYFLDFTETPIEAFKLLKSKPYLNVFSQWEKTHSRYSEMVYNLNEYFNINGYYDEGVKYNKQAVEGLKLNSNIADVVVGQQMVSLSSMQILGGYYKDAEATTDEALKIIRKDGEKVSGDYMMALNSAATLYATIGLYDKAEDLLYKSKSIAKKVGSEGDKILLNSIENLAIINTRLGNYSETEELLQSVIDDKISMYGSTTRRLIKPYNAMGRMFLIKGEFPDAEKNIRQSLKISKSTFGDTTLNYAENLTALVSMYLELGNYKDGLTYATQVYELRKRKLRPNHILLAESLTDIGLMRYYAGDKLENVEKYFIEAKEIIQKNFNQKHPLYAEALKNLAYVYIGKNQLDSALEVLNQADEIYSNTLGSRNISSGEVSRLKGDIYSYQGRFDRAKREYERASKFFRKIFSEEHPDYLKTQSKLAQSYFIDGDIAKVESILDFTTASYLNYTKMYFPTLSEEEKSRFWAKIKPDFEFYNTVAVKYKDTKEKYLSNMYDFALATKGLLLNSSIKTRNAILNSGDTTLIKTFERWIEKKEFLTSTLAQSVETLASSEVDVKALKDEIFDLEKELSTKSEAFASTYESQFYTWKDVKDALKDNEAAIEIVRYRTFDTGFNKDKITYAALIVTKETRRNPQIVVLENGVEMENKHFNRLRNSVKFKVRDENAYDQYWKPIQDAIGKKTVIYLSPDGIYNQLNIESLATRDGGYVIDKLNIRVVNSTKTLPEYRSKGAKKERKRSSNEPMVAMLFGNPKYYKSDKGYEAAIEANPSRALTNSKVPQLPGTEKEIELVSDLLEGKGWKVENYLGEDATEEVIKNTKNVTLLHIATHGFFDDKPRQKNQQFGLFDDDNPLERSGLLTGGGGEVLLEATDNYNIADGVLTAYEAMNLNFDKTELVVLSACETGRGQIEQGEGVFGLQRAFLVAGADALVMSLFQVSDEVTQKLMVEFYKFWLAGRTKREAFNAAQLVIKAEYPEPIYWGAFLMIAKE
jgi:CHAT domain-containing protein